MTLLYFDIYYFYGDGMSEFNLQDSLGYYFSKSFQLFKEVFNKALTNNGYNLNGDHWVIILIVRNNPGIIQSKIAKIMNRDKPAITRIIDFMEQEGFVERRNTTNDRRSYNVFLTSGGEKLYENISRIADELSKDILDEVEETNIRIMKNTLAKLIGKMKEINKQEK